MGKVSNSVGKKQSKQGFWSHFSEISVYSWRSMLAHPWVLSLLFAINIIFVFFFSFLEQPLNMKIKYSLELLSSSVQTIVQAVDVPQFIASVKQRTLTDVLINDKIIQQLAQDVVLLLLLLAAVAYVVFTFFQSTSVRTIGWMVIDKKPYSIWAFIKLNFVWFVIYLCLRLLIFVADIAYTFVSSGKTLLPDLSILYVFVHVILFYFVFISYTFITDSSAWRAVKNSLRFGIFRLSTMKYYLINFIPFGLYLMPATKDAIIVPALNLLSSLGVIGSGLQLLILFVFYTFYIANIFTITYEVVKSSNDEKGVA